MDPNAHISLLSIPMDDNDAGAATVGEYLSKLLAEVWRYDEGFSGKRPFGNSGWKWEVYLALVAGGATAGEVDEDGYLVDCDEAAADALIFDAIRRMGGM